MTLRLQDDPALPHCVWTVAGAAPGRTEVPEYVLVIMGLELDDPALNTSGRDCSSGASEAPPLATVAAVNDAAHSADGTISLLLGALDDPRVQTHGIRDPSSGEFTCVCLTVGLGDDLSIQFVATQARQQCSGRLCCAERVSAQLERDANHGTLYCEMHRVLRAHLGFGGSQRYTSKP